MAVRLSLLISPASPRYISNSPPIGITDKVAKESSDSTASDHSLHDTDNKATSGGQVAAEAHKANPVGVLGGVAWKAGLINRQGPVHADNLPAAASKEELKKRAEELNK